MATYYVKTDGSNGNSGTSSGNAWATIDYAVNHASLVPGDVIKVITGTYTERVVPSNKSGTALNPIRIETADGAGSVTIDGNYTYPTGSFVGAGYNRVVATNGTFTSYSGPFTGLGYVWGALLHPTGISHWEFDGFNVTQSRGRGISCEGTTGMTFNDMTVSYNRHASMWVKADDTIITNSELFEGANFAQVSRSSSIMNWPVIVNFNGGLNFTVQYCDIHSSWGEGIGGGQSENFFIYDNRIYDNMALNVYMHYSYNTRLERNIIFHTLNNRHNRGGQPSSDVVANMESKNFPGYRPSDYFYIRNNLIVTRSKGIDWWGNQGGGTTSGYIDFINNTVIAYNVPGFENAVAMRSITSGNTHSNTIVANNIFQHRNGTPAFGGTTITQNFTFHSNIWSTSPPSSMVGTNNIIGNANLVAIPASIPSGTIPAPSSFKKVSGSLGIDNGVTSPASGVTAPTSDFFGNSRGVTRDRGFDEFTTVSGGGGGGGGGTSTQHYVSLSGNNADGLTLATAWNELNQINWGVIEPGDTITIEAGVYGTTLDPTVSGTQGDPIFIRTTGGTVYIRGSRGTTLLPEAGTTGITAESATENGVWLDQSWIDIDGGDWKGIIIEGWQGRGIYYRKESSNCRLANVEIRNCGWVESKTTWTGGGITYSGSAAAYPNGPGVSLGGSSHRMYRVIIHDNGQDAIQSTFNDDNNLGDFKADQCWFYNARPHTIVNARPIGGANSEAFNYASHADLMQIYSGGIVDGIELTNCVLGPGGTHALIMGQTGAGSPTEQISNGNFASNFSNWSHTDSNGGIKTINAYLPSGGTGQSARLSPSNAGDMKFYQDNISITSGTSYTLTWWLSSSVAGKNLQVYLHATSGFGTHYGINGSVVTQATASNWVQHSITFTANTTTTAARLTFNIGPYITSGEYFRFSMVSLIGAGAANTSTINVNLDNVLIFGMQDSAILGYTGVDNDGLNINRCTIHSTNTKYHLIQWEGTGATITNSIFDGGPSDADINFTDSGEPLNTSNNYQQNAGSVDTIGIIVDDTDGIFADVGTSTFDINDYTVVNAAVVDAGATGTIPEMFGVSGLSGPDTGGNFTFINTTDTIRNGDFENSSNYLSGWTFFGANSVAESHTGANSTDTSVKMTMTSSTNIQLYQSGIEITNGTQYLLSFYAYSSTGHDMNVKLFMHDAPYTNYGLSQSVNLGTTWEQHQIIFTATGDSNDARLSFAMESYAATGDIYYIDEVTMNPYAGEIPSVKAIATGTKIGSRIGVR